MFPASAVPGGTLADQPLPEGPARVSQPSMTIRARGDVWTLDAGARHGIVPGTADDPTVVAVRGSRPPRAARVVEVRAEDSVVEPIGWEAGALDRRAVHPVVLTQVPLPPEAVRLETAAAGEYIRPLISRTLAVAGEGGVPSPYIRVVEGADPATLRVRSAGPGTVLLCRADGTALAPPHPCRSPEQAARLVADVEHIARWRLVAGLGNPVSRLAGAVRVEVAAVRRGQSTDRPHHPPLPLRADGSLAVDYHRAADGTVQAPAVFVRIRNTTDRMLYCVLLRLTDQFRLDADLFPGDWIGPRGTASAARGRAVRTALPPGRPAVPGTAATEWFKVLISEAPLKSALLSLPRLGESVPSVPAPPSVPPPFVARSASSAVPDRLGYLALHRQAVLPEPAVPAEWAVATLRVTVRLPGPVPAGR